MPTTSAVPCQMPSPVPLGISETGAGVRPEICAAIADACSNDIPPLLMFDSKTPLDVFFSNSNPEHNTHRKNLWLTSSDYANAIGIKGSYESRFAFTMHRLRVTAKPPPNDFLQRLLSTGRRMEPHALRLWNRLYRGCYIAVPSGLLLDMQHPELFGATPDGLVFNSSTFRLVGVLEIKNPQKRELARVPEKIPARYLIQILGQLMCVPVQRFFYIEYQSDTSFTAWEGEVTDEMKDWCRTLLLEYKALVKKHKKTPETFPKKTKLITLDPSTFGLRKVCEEVWGVQ